MLSCPSRRAAAFGLAITLLSPACGPSTSPPAPPSAVSRLLGSWSGRGDRMIGSVVSDSGRFRVRWEARHEPGQDAGRFRLAVHSATSGRLIEVIVNHTGAGQGTADFTDEPRIYDFAVESAGVEWVFAVEEVPRPAPGRPVR